MLPAKRTIAERIVGYGLQLTVAMLLIAAMVLGIAGLHWRADAKFSVDPSPPLPVATATIRLQDSYRIEQRFAGRLEPRRETPLGFERAGLVTDVLVDEGDRLQAGQVIARLDQASLEARRAGLIADRRRTEAELELALLTSERQADLTDKGFASAQRFDEARLNAKALEAALTAIDASIQALDIDREKSEIKAPFDGVVAERYLDEGRIVSAGTPVIRVLETGTAQVRIGLPPDAAAGLRVGDRMDLSASGRPLMATLLSLRPDLTMTTRTVPTLLAVNDVDCLPFGQMVELTLSKTVTMEGAWVPFAALSEGRNGLWSLLTTGEEEDTIRARREAVEILHVDGERAFVRGSFIDGDRMIVDGSNRLVAGQRIAPDGQG